MDWRRLKSMSRETMYLIVGDDISCLEDQNVSQESIHSVTYFRVAGARVIEGRGRYFCSCGYDICWHIMRVVLSDGCSGQKEEIK